MSMLHINTTYSLLNLIYFLESNLPFSVSNLLFCGSISNPIHPVLNPIRPFVNPIHLFPNPFCPFPNPIHPFPNPFCSFTYSIHESKSQQFALLQNLKCNTLLLHPIHLYVFAIPILLVSNPISPFRLFESVILMYPSAINFQYKIILELCLHNMPLIN
jgi:hypothetical protein